MSDIVERLRKDGYTLDGDTPDPLLEEAACEIERLREAWVDGKMREDRDTLAARLADIESQNRVMWDVASDREARLAEARANAFQDALDCMRDRQARDHLAACLQDKYGVWWKTDSANVRRCFKCGHAAHNDDCVNTAPDSASEYETGEVCEACGGTGKAYLLHSRAERPCPMCQADQPTSASVQPECRICGSRHDPSEHCFDAMDARDGCPSDQPEAVK